MKTKVIIIATILLASVSTLIQCKDEARNIPYRYVQLDNHELESEIIDYRARIKSGKIWMDSIYVEVSMRTISDSVRRYVLSPIIDYNHFKYFGPFFICNVGGEDVFFLATAGWSFGKKENSLFRLSDDYIWALTKRYFPKRYHEKISKGYISNSINNHPELCFLTFLNDSLIDKRYKQGFFLDYIKMTIEGKEDLY